MYVGVDLGGTNIKIGLFDQKFELIDELRKLTESHKNSTVVLENILAGIKELLVKNNCPQKSILSMGVGVPGLMDIEKGISLFSPNFSDWQDVPVVAYFEKSLGIPTYIDNDVRMNLYGEWELGVGKDAENLILLTLGTGLGSGIVVNNQVLYGHNSNAGEVGHMNMYREGRPCACGSSGCLGRYVSARGIVVTAQEKLAQSNNSLLRDWLAEDDVALTSELIAKAYDLDDPLAIEIFEETGKLLGFGLTNLINLFNPEMIILGGGVAMAGDRLFSHTKKIINERALELSQKHCQIVQAELGDASGMIGAAVYAAKKSASTHL